MSFHRTPSHLPTRFLCTCTMLVVTAIGMVGCQNEAELPSVAEQDAASKNATAEQLSDAQLAEHVSALLTLMRDRLELMRGVAMWKWNEKKPIEAPEREAELLARLVEQGGEVGLNAEAIRDFFSAQMTAAKLVQHEHFERWQQAGKESFPEAPSLQDELRPAITKLSEQLLDELLTLRPYWESNRLDSIVAEKAEAILQSEVISDEVREAVIAPLRKSIDADQGANSE